MNEPLKVLCIIGSGSGDSATHAVVGELGRRLERLGAQVNVFDPARETLPLFKPESAYQSLEFLALKPRVEAADVYVLATPDYHGSISGTLKNILDHFWKEFCGKLFVPIVASNEKGLTVIDQIRTIARQCYAWSLPYGFSFSARQDLVDGKTVGAELNPRLEMLVHDIHAYGTVLAGQRRADLASATPGFLARHRSPG